MTLPPPFFRKNVKVKRLWRKTVQECDSKGVMGAIRYTFDSRRVSGVKMKNAGKMPARPEIFRGAVGYEGRVSQTLTDVKDDSSRKQLYFAGWRSNATSDSRYWNASKGLAKA